MFNLDSHRKIAEIILPKRHKTINSQMVNLGYHKKRPRSIEEIIFRENSHGYIKFL